MSKKHERIKAETARRIAAGDTSDYVQKSAKQYGLTVPTQTTYDPNKVSHAIQETTGLSGRDAHLANQAFRAQTANNQRIQAQNAKRRAVEEAFHRQGNINRSDFTGKVEGSGIFGTNIGAKYSGKPKLREGLTSDEYHNWMRKLNKINPPMMEQLFPWGSGKTARNIVTMATPAKYLGIGANWLKDKTMDTASNLKNLATKSTMVENITEDWKNRKKGDGLGGFVEDALNMVGIGNTEKTNEFIETQTDTDGEIKTNMLDIKSDKKNTLDSQALDELINQRDSLWQQIQAGNNSSGLYLQFNALDNEIQKSLNKDQGKLQNMKKGGIVSLAAGGPLEKERVQQSFSPLNSAMNFGIGGLGGLFVQGGPRQHPIRPRIPHVQQPFNQDPWGIKPMG
ncbi:MAG TPA: hypothetical protein DCS66_19295, partial [Flavobacteriaceae bacterium]|nr:hypothetical protein [Flavobacteriaceae bacterium]